MTLEVTFLPGARRDFDESVDWYAERSVVAARRFVIAVDVAVQRVVENPGTLPFVDGQHQECPLKRFPFRIVFRHLEKQILIVALAHAKRKGKYWQNRF